MAHGTTIQARIDTDSKAKATEILDTLGISMSEAILLYIRQVILHRGIPFDVKIPNDLTAKVLADSEKGRRLHKAASAAELFEELDK